MIWFQGDFYLDDLHCFDVEEPQQREREILSSPSVISRFVALFVALTGLARRRIIQPSSDQMICFFLAILPVYLYLLFISFYCVNMRVGRTCRESGQAKTWETVSASNAPPKRKEHTAVLDQQQRMWIFGGWHNSLTLKKSHQMHCAAFGAAAACLPSDSKVI